MIPYLNKDMVINITIMKKIKCYSKYYTPKRRNVDVKFQQE